MRWALIIVLMGTAWMGNLMSKSNYQLVCAQLSEMSNKLPNVQECEGGL
jgi:hypothetical protein